MTTLTKEPLTREGAIVQTRMTVIDNPVPKGNDRSIPFITWYQVLGARFVAIRFYPPDTAIGSIQTESGHNGRSFEVLAPLYI